MKNKIAIASAFLAASSFSMGEIVINDFLSFEGFIDMSYVHYDGEIADVNESDNNFAIDQVEINWLFDFDPVTAQIDFDYEDNVDSTVEVEQAFATYHMGDGSAITAGRYDSMLGFEAFEPTGLYQFSTAYSLPNFTGDLISGFVPGAGGDDIAVVTSAISPIAARQSQGVKYTYDSENSFFGISIQDGTYNYSGRLGGDNDFDGTAVDDGGYAVEIAGSVNFGGGFAWFLGGSYEEGDGLGTTNINTDDTEAYILNTYVTYETGAWVFAGELSYGENEWDQTSIGGGPAADLEVESLTALLMANFAYSEQGSVTGRISYLDSEADITGGGEIEIDGIKYTLAHGYAFTDNLVLVTELSYTDGDVETDLIGNFDEDYEELLGAVELIFSF